MHNIENEISKKTYWLLQIDISSHSKWIKDFQSKPEGMIARTELGKRLAKALNNYSFEEVFWAGDGGLFFSEKNVHKLKEEVTNVLKAADEMFHEFEVWKTAKKHQNRDKLNLRISIHAEEIYVHDDTGYWYSDGLSLFLKHERKLAIEGTVIITSKVFEDIFPDAEQKKWQERIVTLEDEVEWRTYYNIEKNPLDNFRGIQASISHPARSFYFHADLPSNEIEWEYQGEANEEFLPKSDCLEISGTKYGCISKIGHTWRNFIFSCDTKIIKKPAGIIIRAKDLNHYLLIQIGNQVKALPCIGEFDLEKHPYIPREPVDVSEKLFHVEISVNENHVTVKIDEKLKFNEVLPLDKWGLSEGRIGFRCDGSERAQFSDIKLELIEESKVLKFSDEALADVDFALVGNDEITEIVRLFKILTWPKQEIAINKLINKKIPKFSDDLAFILGRNIFQAGDGGERGTVNYIENLRSNLAYFESNRTANCVLSGIFFEMYFNKEGNFRRGRKKYKLVNEIFELQTVKKFQNAIDFIHHKLEKYKDYLFVLPSNPPETLKIELVIKNKTEIDDLLLNGESVLYPDDKIEDDRNPYLSRLSDFTVNELKEDICERCLVPIKQMEIVNREKLRGSFEIPEGLSILYRNP